MKTPPKIHLVIKLTMKLNKILFIPLINHYNNNLISFKHKNHHLKHQIILLMKNFNKIKTKKKIYKNKRKKFKLNFAQTLMNKFMKRNKISHNKIYKLMKI